MMNKVTLITGGGQASFKIHQEEAHPLIAGLKDAAVPSDKAYDDDTLIKTFEIQGFRILSHPRKNQKDPRDYNKDYYKDRHPIECFSGKINYFRRISSRFDKMAQAYLALLNIVAIDIWLE